MDFFLKQVQSELDPEAQVIYLSSFFFKMEILFLLL
jgi:hypothetical protein